MQRRTMPATSSRDRLFETLPEDRALAAPSDAPKSAFSRTGILPSQAIGANDHRLAGLELALDIEQSSWLVHELQDGRR